jgi:hypothetical protein
MRRIFYRIVAAVVALVAAAEALNHLVDDSMAPHRMHSLMHALVSVALIAGLVAQLGRRPVPAGVQLIAAIAVASGVSDLAGARFGGLEVVAGVAALILAAISPARAELVRTNRPDRPMLGLAVVILAAALPYVIHQLTLQHRDRAEFGYETWAATTLLVVAFSTFLAGLGAGGWMLPATFAVAGLAAVGGMSLALPHEPSSLGVAGGAAAILGAVAVGAVAVRSRTVRSTVNASVPA